MQPNEYLDVITRESAALADAAERAGVDALVPSCPGWTVADLVTHVGEIQQWASITVEQRATERISRRSLPPAPPATDVVHWFREQTAALVSTLAATDSATPVWSWTDANTAHFWFRRQAHEVAVHRWDAERAARSEHTLDTGIAADGVDECLAMLPFRNRDVLLGSGETVHLHCTDTNGEWLVTLAANGPVIERVHAKGDVAARGTASDLDLFVWGRVGPSTFQVFGDAELLERFQAATRA